MIIAAALQAAFGRNLVSSAYSLFIMLISASGMFVLLNSELFGLLTILSITIIGIICIVALPLPKTFFDESVYPKHHFRSVSVIGILTALISSLAGGTRWEAVEINYELNSLILIFTKYLPIIILIIITISVALGSFASVMKKEKLNA